MIQLRSGLTNSEVICRERVHRQTTRPDALLSFSRALTLDIHIITFHE